MKGVVWSEDELNFLKSNKSSDINFFLNSFLINTDEFQKVVSSKCLLARKV